MTDRRCSCCIQADALATAEDAPAVRQEEVKAHGSGVTEEFHSAAEMPQQKSAAAVPVCPAEGLAGIASHARAAQLPKNSASTPVLSELRAKRQRVEPKRLDPSAAGVPQHATSKRPPLQDPPLPAEPLHQPICLSKGHVGLRLLARAAQLPEVGASASVPVLGALRPTRERAEPNRLDPSAAGVPQLASRKPALLQVTPNDLPASAKPPPVLAFMQAFAKEVYRLPKECSMGNSVHGAPGEYQQQ